MAEIDWSLVPRLTEHRQLGGRTPWFHGAPVAALEVDPKGETFVAGSSGSLRLYHTATGELIRTFQQGGLQGHQKAAFTPEGSFLIAYRPDSIGVWEVATGELVREIEIPEAGPIMAFDPDRRRAVVSGPKAVPFLLDLEGGRALRKLRNRSFLPVFESACFVEGEGVVISTGNELSRWDPGESKPRWRIKLGAPGGSDAMSRAAGTRWFAAAPDGQIHLRHASSGKLWRRLGRVRTRSAAMKLELSPAGTRLAAISAEQLQVWDLPAREPILDRVLPEEDGVAAFLPDGNALLLGFSSGLLQRMELPRGSVVEPRRDPANPHAAAIVAVAFQPDGGVVSVDDVGVAVRWEDGVPRILSALPEELRAAPHPAPPPTEAGAELPPTEWFQPGGTPPRWLDKLGPLMEDLGVRRPSLIVVGSTLAAAVSACQVDIYDLDRKPDGALKALWPGRKSPGSFFFARVQGVALHPDQKRVAIASLRTDAPLQLWDAMEGKPLAILEGHESAVTCVAFSPDGTRLASGSVDRTVRVWPV